MGLDTLEFVLDVERELGLSLPDQEIEKVATVGQLADLVWRCIEGGKSQKDPSLLPSSRHEVFEYLSDALVREFKINRRLITEGATFARDLGLD
jgi:acyl carrier protein